MREWRRAGRPRRLTGRSAMLSPPAAAGDFPDPFVVVTPTGYVAYATNARGCNVQVRASSDLLTWTARPDALPVLPRWAVGGHTWSPAVIARGGDYYLWYAVRDPVSGRQVISVAHGERSVGPFEDHSPAPALAQLDLGGSIDPSPFVDEDTGSAFLCWKADANALDRLSTLFIQPLSDDGASLVGSPAPMLVHDRQWERPLIEAPSMVYEAGMYWLFYSAGWWESGGYGIGYATAPNPLGPWTKRTTRRPWVSSQGPVAGPGGAEVFRGRDGTLYVAYHAWEAGSVGYSAGGSRSLRLGMLDLSGRKPVLSPLPVGNGGRGEGASR